MIQFARGAGYTLLSTYFPSSTPCPKRERGSQQLEALPVRHSIDHYTAILSERDPREAGTSNGMTRPWLDTV
jgi:hypothetical protein